MWKVKSNPPCLRAVITEHRDCAAGEGKLVRWLYTLVIQQVFASHLFAFRWNIDVLLIRLRTRVKLSLWHKTTQPVGQSLVTVLSGYRGRLHHHYDTDDHCQYSRLDHVDCVLFSKHIQHCSGPNLQKRNIAYKALNTGWFLKLTIVFLNFRINWLSIEIYCSPICYF